MKLPGTPGDRWSLARVYGAMVVVGVLGGLVGYVFDLLVGPAIGQSGWWTVTATGGMILGATWVAVREFATPIPGSRRTDGPARSAAAESEG